MKPFGLFLLTVSLLTLPMLANAANTNNNGQANTENAGNPGKRTVRTDIRDSRRRQTTAFTGDCDVIGTPNSKVYHVKGTKSFPDALAALKEGRRKCFSSEAAAVKAGFRKSKV